MFLRPESDTLLLYHLQWLPVVLRMKSKLFTVASNLLLSKPSCAADMLASLCTSSALRPVCPWISTPKLCPKVGAHLSARLCPCHSFQPGISPSEASSKYPSSFLFSSCYSNSASPLLLSVFLFLHWLVYCLCLLMSSVQALWGQGHCPSCTLDIWTVPELQLVNE